MEEFNLSEVFRNNYKYVIPSKSILLSIVHLYEQVGKGQHNFTEAQIREALQKGEMDAPSSNSATQYTPHERHNRIIHLLQEYYLIRHLRKQTYRLTPYAMDFCKRIQEVLFKQINSSQVEKILTDLHERLKQGNDFVYWATTVLPKFQPDILQQIDALDNEVDAAVRQLRGQANSTDEEYLKMLHQIGAILDILSQQAIDLRSAFSRIDDIRYLVDRQQFYDSSDEINTAIQRAQAFLRECKENLASVNERIDRIRPRIRELFGNLNKRHFDSLTELFLQHLLEQSHYVRDRQRKNRRLMPPTEIKLVPIRSKRILLTNIVRSTAIFLQPPLSVVKRPVDQQKQAELKMKADQIIAIRLRVIHWVKVIENELYTKNQVFFADYFFRILHEEQSHGFPIAVRATHQFVKQIVAKTEYKIEIKPEDLLLTTTPIPITIWKLMIMKK